MPDIFISQAPSNKQQETRTDNSDIEPTPEIIESQEPPEKEVAPVSPEMENREEVISDAQSKPNEATGSLLAESKQENNVRRENKISVNPVVSEMASWYEKARMSMEYAEDEVLFRSATERILKRHLFIIKPGREIAPSLVRELAWAKYIPSGTIPESILTKIAERIDLYLELNDKTPTTGQLGGVQEYILELLSADLALLLLKNPERDLASVMFLKVLREKVNVEGLSNEDREALLVVNLYRSLSREDNPYLRYRLFNHYYGELNSQNINSYSHNFEDKKQRVEAALKTPLNNRISAYTKRNTAPFLILEDLMKKYHGERFEELISDKQKLHDEIILACEARYRELSQKIRRAVIRGIVFIFLTKTVIALFVEGTIERFLFGNVVWESIALNTLFPPLLLFISLFLIEPPDNRNSEKIATAIESILHDNKAASIEEFGTRAGENTNRYLQAIFFSLWLSTGLIVLFGIHLLLDIIKMNIISQGVFIFFLAIVLFLIYRIRETSRTYSVGEEKTRITSLIFDLFFIPFVYLGRRLTLTVARFNVIMIIFDLLIETPFKTMFMFFEQWLFFLRSQREKLE